MKTETMEEPILEIALEDDTRQHIEAFGQEVAKLEAQASTIAVTDDVTEEVALIFIDGCKKTHADIERYRDAKVRPHNTYVANVNSGVKPFKDVLARIVSATDALRSQYLTRKQRLIEEENRRRIAEAEQQRLEQERKEREAREAVEAAQLEKERLEKEQQEREYQEELAKLELENRRKAELAAAEAARIAGDKAAEDAAKQNIADAKAAAEALARKSEEDRLATEAEKAKLDKQIVRQETKADLASMASTMVAPEIAVNSSMGARTLANGGRVGTRETDEPYFTNGMPVYADPIKKKYAEYFRDDVRLSQDLPARYFTLDLAKVVRDLKNGVPVPGMALRSKYTMVSRKS